MKRRQRDNRPSIVDAAAVAGVSLGTASQALNNRRGGVPGFYNLLRAIGDPEHDQHDEMLGWLGDDFDPEAFSVDEVNRGLAH